MLMEMNRYLSFTLFTGLSLLTTIPIEAYTLNPNKQQHPSYRQMLSKYEA